MPTAPSTHEDVIAVVAAMTTRGLEVHNVTRDLAIFRNLLPSLLQTVESGFEYWSRSQRTAATMHMDSNAQRVCTLWLIPFPRLTSVLSRFYLGYDLGDPILDDVGTRELISDWFDAHISSEALSTKGVVIKLVFSALANPSKKPGPAFNHACGAAFADGAEWIYRINDDQIFDTPWARAFTKALKDMGPPYGVVGVSQCVTRRAGAPLHG